MAELSGKTLGKYQIVARVGRGGMAEVYKAFQPGLERHVAVKVMHSYLSDQPDFMGRFQREARAVADLRHPNIVQVFDFDQTEDGVAYMVMEYLEGQTLKATLDQRHREGLGALPLTEILRVMEGLCGAVGYAHTHGMVHRDIKPANVMLTGGGRVILTDFGVARIVGATSFTASGAVTGTPAYMSPEQGQGLSGDERSDIYALGVVLYEMAAGRPPFDAETPVAILLKHITAPVPPLHDTQPAAPPALEKVISCVLAKDPQARPASAQALWEELRAVSAGDAPSRPGRPGRVEMPERPDDTVARAPAPVREASAAAPPRAVPAAPPLRPSPAARRRWLWGLPLALALLLAGVMLAPAALAPGVQGAPSPTPQAVGAGVTPPIQGPASPTAPPSPTPDPVARQNQNGYAQLKAGDYPAAYDTFSGVLQTRPTSVEALLGHAQAAVGVRLMDEAAADLRQALQLAPDDPRPLLAQARFTLQFEPAYNPEAVQAQIERAIALEPALAEGYYTRGWAALYYLAAAPAQREAGLSCLPELALAAGSGEAASALVDLQKAVDLQPDQADYRLALADALYATHALRPAREQLDAALKLQPGDFTTLFRRAIVSFSLADYALADDDLSAVLALPTPPGEPGQWLAWRALTDLRRGALSEALDDVQAALAAAPDSPAALYVHGLVLLQQGRPDEALASLDRVTAQPPAEYDCPFLNPVHNFEINADRGLALFARGEYAAAIEAYNQSLTLYPAWSMGYYYRGQAYQASGQAGPAAQDYQTAAALATSPDERDAFRRALEALAAPTPTP